VAGLALVSGSRYLYVPSSGPTPPLLPPTVVGRATPRAGDARAGRCCLAGSYRRIDPIRPQLGSLVVLLPVGESAKFTLNLQVLVFFFIVVLSVALGVVMLTAPT